MKGKERMEVSRPSKEKFTRRALNKGSNGQLLNMVKTHTCGTI